MVSVLVPWQPAQGVGWAFMDDRSTAAKSKSHDEAEMEFEKSSRKSLTGLRGWLRT